MSDETIYTIVIKADAGTSAHLQAKGIIESAIWELKEENVPFDLWATL
jgi:hypothetical protein